MLIKRAQSGTEPKTSRRHRVFQNNLHSLSESSSPTDGDKYK